MLEVQKFLINGGTLKELKDKFFIRIVPCPQLNLISLNAQILSPKKEKIVQECRALILSTDDWSVAYKTMPNFYDISDEMSQELIKNFDWESARAYEKLDGAMIGLYYFKEEWRICSRFSPTGSWYAFGLGSKESSYSWKELTIKTIEEMGIDYNLFLNSLNKDIFYTYELCTFENQVGVVYNSNFLRLIAAINKNSLEELDIYSLYSLVPKAEYITPKNIFELYQLLNKFEAYEKEGFVICDKNFNRAKVINQKYLKALNLFDTSNADSILNNIVSIFDAGGTYNYYYDYGYASYGYYSANNFVCAINPFGTVVCADSTAGLVGYYFSGISCISQPGANAFCRTYLGEDNQSYCYQIYYQSFDPTNPTSNWWESFCYPTPDYVPPPGYIAIISGICLGGSYECKKPSPYDIIGGFSMQNKNEVNIQNVENLENNENNSMCGSSWNPKKDKMNYMKNQSEQVINKLVSMAYWIINQKNNDGEKLKVFWPEILENLNDDIDILDSLLKVDRNILNEKLNLFEKMNLS